MSKGRGSNGLSTFLMKSRRICNMATADKFRNRPFPLEMKEVAFECFFLVLTSFSFKWLQQRSLLSYRCFLLLLEHETNKDNERNVTTESILLVYFYLKYFLMHFDQKGYRLNERKNTWLRSNTRNGHMYLESGAYATIKANPICYPKKG